jgi:VCBS repeat-containing protein
VLANDSDPDRDTLSAVLGSGPSHGTLTLNANGSFAYTPAANYHGSDSFTYLAGDGEQESSPATVTITVGAVNDIPTAATDAYGTGEDTTLTVDAPGVLANDSDPDGDTLSAVAGSGPSHGTLTLNADGSFTYTPAADFNGNDSFTYRASDGSLISDSVTVTLTVTASNDPPTVTVVAAEPAAATTTRALSNSPWPMRLLRARQRSSHSASPRPTLRWCRLATSASPAAALTGR